MKGSEGEGRGVKRSEGEGRGGKEGRVHTKTVERLRAQGARSCLC